MKLPTDLSGRDVRAALERAGFLFRRQKGRTWFCAAMSLSPE